MSSSKGVSGFVAFIGINGLNALAGLLVVKLVSVYTGPAGLAAYGFVKQTADVLLAILTFGGIQVCVQYIAAGPQGLGNLESRFQRLANIQQSVFLVCLAVAVPCLLVSPSLSAGIHLPLAVVIVCIAIFSWKTRLATAWLIVSSEKSRILTRNIMAAIGTAFFVVPLLIWSDPNAALLACLAALLMSAMYCVFSFVVLPSRLRPIAFISFGHSERESLKAFLPLAAVCTLGGIAVDLPTATFKGRMIAGGYDELSGHFEAAYRIAVVYVGIVLGAASMQFAPKIASIESDYVAAKLAAKASLVVFSIGACLILLLYVSVDQVLSTLLSERMKVAAPYLQQFLKAELFHCAAWVPSVYLFARRKLMFYSVFTIISMGYLSIKALSVELSADPVRTYIQAYENMYLGLLVVFGGYIGCLLISNKCNNKV